MFENKKQDLKKQKKNWPHLQHFQNVKDNHWNK